MGYLIKNTCTQTSRKTQKEQKILIVWKEKNSVEICGFCAKIKLRGNLWVLCENKKI